MRRLNGKDALLCIASLMAFLLATFPALWIIYEVVVNGYPAIVKQGMSFFTLVPPLPDGSIGGIATVIQGSLIICSFAAIIAISLSIPSALYIVFHPKSLLSKLGRRTLEVMVEFPTIIVGISVFLVFGVIFHLGLSLITGSMALSIIMIPYTTLQAIEALRIPKDILLEAGYALGIEERKLMLLILSASKKATVTAVLIGLAKILGETAPLLFTTATSFNLFPSDLHSLGTAIPVLIFIYALSPYKNWHDVAWGSALVLLIIVLSIYLLARYMAWRR